MRRVLLVNAALAVTVWLLWGVLGGRHAVDSLVEHWRVALTMVFGSLVGGGTSEGGGAVGFPVLTKALHVPATQARLFTFAIQSVGMTCASISILVNRIQVDRRVLSWGTPPAVLGGVFSVLYLAPGIPMKGVRVAFTLLLTGLGIALLIFRLVGGRLRNPHVPAWGRRERGLVVGCGLLGGALSGAAGVGENTVMFILLVMLFRVSEKLATPTTVILMTTVSVACFLTHVVAMDDFHGQVVAHWLAAAPVVAVGAPLGALICTRLSPELIRVVLWVLISAELVSTLLLVPMPVPSLVGLFGVLALTTLGCLALSRVERYAPLHFWQRDPVTRAAFPLPTSGLSRS